MLAGSTTPSSGGGNGPSGETPGNRGEGGDGALTVETAPFHPRGISIGLATPWRATDPAQSPPNDCVEDEDEHPECDSEQDVVGPTRPSGLSDDKDYIRSNNYRDHHQSKAERRRLSRRRGALPSRPRARRGRLSTRHVAATDAPLGYGGLLGPWLVPGLPEPLISPPYEPPQTGFITVDLNRLLGGTRAPEGARVEGIGSELGQVETGYDEKW
jgi:hypothetical protein